MPERKILNRGSLYSHFQCRRGKPARFVHLWEQCFRFLHGWTFCLTFHAEKQGGNGFYQALSDL